MYSEAIEITKMAASRTQGYFRFTDALFLAQFSFPLEQKLAMMEIEFNNAEAEERCIFSLMWFREAFQKAEIKFHKGPPAVKGDMKRIGEILGIHEGIIRN